MSAKIEYFAVKLSNGRTAYGELVRRQDNGVWGLRRVHKDGAPFDQPHYLLAAPADCTAMRMNVHYGELEPVRVG